MRRVSLLVGVTVLLWACTEGAVSTTTTTTAPTSTTIGSSTSSTTVSSTSTSTSPEWPEVLVTNQDGVFYIDTIGEVTQLVKGRVAYAVDDTRGGLLLQVERGRSMSAMSEPDAGRDTIVWWVPRDAPEAQALLVPTPGSNHSLSLHEAAVIDGRLLVLYTREDSTYRPEYSQHGWLDALRRFDLDTGEVNDMWVQSVWEAGYMNVSAGGGIVAATGWDEGGHRCFFLDPAASSSSGYDPMAWDTIMVDLPGAPNVDWSFDGPSGCSLSPDGSTLAYVESRREGQEPVEYRVTVVETWTGEPIGESTVPWPVGSVDVSLDYLLLNRTGEGQQGGSLAMLVHMTNDEDSWDLPVAGTARMVTAPIDIDGPVVPPTPAAIQLRADGLGVVDFGDPVEEAVERLVEVLGAPTLDDSATGEGLTYSRWLKWATPELEVAFNRKDLSNGGVDSEVLRLTNWVYQGSGADPGWVLETPEGISIGSTATDLRDAYGDELWLFAPLDEERDTYWGWGTATGIPVSWGHWWSEGSLGLFGWFDRNPEEPDARVVGLHAGWLMPGE